MTTEELKYEIKLNEVQAKNLRYLASTLKYNHQNSMRNELLSRAKVFDQIVKDLKKELSNQK
jgi:hypothetical protein